MRASLLVGAAAVVALLHCSGVEAARARHPLLRPSLAAAKADVACGFDGLDFSPLVGRDVFGIGADNISPYSDGLDSYHLSVCAPLSSPASAQCGPNSAACYIRQPSTGRPAEFQNLGDWNSTSSPVWSYVDQSNPAAGVQYNITAPVKCPIFAGTADSTTTLVQFVCAAEEREMTVQPPAYGQSLCVFTYTLPTPLACASLPPPPPPKSDCTFEDSYGNVYDLSALRTENGTAILPQRNAPHSDLAEMIVNPCGGVPSIPACVDAAVCMRLVNSSDSEWHPLALTSALPVPTFVSVPRNGFAAPFVQLTYNNGRLGDEQALVFMSFTCWQTTTPRWSNSMAFEEVAPRPNQWLVGVDSPSACPKAPRPGHVQQPKIVLTEQ